MALRSGKLISAGNMAGALTSEILLAPVRTPGHVGLHLYSAGGGGATRVGSLVVEGRLTGGATAWTTLATYAVAATVLLDEILNIVNSTVRQVRATWTPTGGAGALDIEATIVAGEV